MRDLADRAGIAAVLLAAQALGACVGDADDPRWRAGRGRLVEDVWTISDSGDFNADGTDDILWNDEGKSKGTIWLMATTGVLSRGVPISGPPGEGWRAAWAADFNGDGMADVRWYNAVSHGSAIYLMNGTEILLPGPVFAGPPGAGWERVTSSDFNADGMADLLWHNALTHAIEVWLMNGTEVLLPGSEITSPLGHDWVSARSGDLNADGLIDVLWSDTTSGAISVGLMSGTAPLLQGPVIPAPPGDGWIVTMTSDFNSDGMADLLWYNPVTQVISIWLMSGTELLLPGPEIPAPPGGGWDQATVGDFNGDGMADVIWASAASQRFTVFLMNGTEVLLRGAEIPGPSGP